jgi:orotate phosphoribosyltransferase
MDYKKDFVAFLIRSEALLFGEFTLKSGRISPYLVNTGKFDTGGKIGTLGGYYASCIVDLMDKGLIPKDIDVVFGPAYKGIPLAVATSIALSEKFDLDVGYSFNRKEDKDHGEGGNLVGRKLKDGDKVLILDDVITAGTAIREVLPIVKNAADIEIVGMVFSVDRMERGRSEKSAVAEVREHLGVGVFPIVTVLDIVDSLEGGAATVATGSQRETIAAMRTYLEAYGA